LDELIQQTGKKKNYLSIAMGHSGRYLNDARKQNTNIKGNDLLVLAAELGTSPEYLTGQTDEKKPAPKGELSEERREVLSMIDSMSDKELIRLQQLIKIAKEGL
jgi:hypothetical protein